MRQFTSPTTSVLYFLHSDHLGSTSLTTDASGTLVARQLYDAWGNVRYVTGTLPTDIGYTGQRLDNSTGLMYYRARYYAQGLGRFISADTIVPDSSNPQSLNRLSYTRNNPLKYIDPDGHRETDGCDYEGCSATQWDMDRAIGNAQYAESRKFYRDCANGGGAECNGLQQVGDLVLLGATLLFEPVDTVASAIGCIGGDGWSCAAALVPGLTSVGGKAVGHLLSASDKLSDAALAGRKTLVIGESMEDRVIPYAKKLGAEIYEGMPGFKPGMEDLAYAHNMSFIQQKMAEGYRIVDIGPDFAKRAIRGEPSRYYNMERMITKNYAGYQKAFTRVSKNSLIVNGP